MKKHKINNLPSVRLKWYNTDKSIQKKYRKQIIEELKNMKGLDSPDQLLTHSIFIENDYFGPSIHVYGKKNSNYFHCEYFTTTEWSSI
jgi:hypothetical protein